MVLARSRRSMELRRQVVAIVGDLELLQRRLDAKWWLIGAIAAIAITFEWWSANTRIPWNGPLLRTGESALWTLNVAFVLLSLAVAYFFVPRRSIMVARSMSSPLLFFALAWSASTDWVELIFIVQGLAGIATSWRSWRTLESFEPLDVVSKEPSAEFGARMRERLERAQELIEYARLERRLVFAHIAVGATVLTMALVLRQSVYTERPKEQLARFEEALRAADIASVARLALPERRELVRSEVIARLDRAGGIDLRLQPSFATYRYNEARELCVHIPTQNEAIETAWNSVGDDWHLASVR